MTDNFNTEINRNNDENNIIEFKNFSFSYSGSDRLALEDINLKVFEGTINLVIGKSGSGKTSLLKMLKTSLMPAGKYSGTVSFKGQEISQMDLRSQTENIGFVSQNPDNQIVTDTVWHELAFGLENLGLDNSSIRSRVAEMAEYFGISSWYEKKTNTLSGGQKQLVNLASVMVTRPKVLLLDEPTAQLDPVASKRFLDQIVSLNRDLGTSIIMIEHNLENVFEWADTVFALDSSKLIYAGNKDGLITRLNELNSELKMSLPKPVLVYEKLSGKTDKITIPQVRRWINNEFVDMPENIRKNVEKFLEDSEAEADNTHKNTENKADKKCPIISIKNLSFSYKDSNKDVISNLNLDINEGEITAILGGNAAGKSTLLKLITKVYKAKSGKIKYMKDKRLIALPQNPLTIFTEVSLEEELAEVIMSNPALYKGLSLEEKKQIVEDSLKSMGLLFARKMHPYDLSGGEAQKLALAKVLLMKPDILLLDEPTKGLDVFFKEELAKRLEGLVKSEKMTILLVTHDLEWAANHANSCALLFDKNIASRDKVRKFFSGNMFFTTSVNRIMSDLFKNCIKLSDVDKINNLSKDW